MSQAKHEYLDRREPHTAVNRGDTERVHLAVDCIANAETADLLRQATPAPAEGTS